MTGADSGDPDSHGGPPVGLTPGGDAVELTRLNEQVTTARSRAVEVYRAWQVADTALRAAIQDRDVVARRLQTAAVGPALVPPVPPGPGPAPVPPPTAPPVPAGLPAMPPSGAAPETSTRTVQNVLFVLGGLLLGTAAIAFTAVAWTTFGVGGRAAVLGVVTLIALGIPLFALGRGLRATAETFVAIGLLLVILDGYAAWYVNLGHVQQLSSSRYAAIVAAVTAVIAFAYRRLVGLLGPAFIAALTVQPVILLFFESTDPGAAGLSLLASATAALNVVVAWRHRAAAVPTTVAEPAEPPTVEPAAPAASGRRMPRAVAAVFGFFVWLLFGAWIAAAGLAALVAEISGTSVAALARAGAATIVAALVLVAATTVGRKVDLLRIAAGVVVVAIGIAVAFLVTTAWPGHALLLCTLVAAALAGLVVAVRPVLPEAVRRGPRIGAIVVTGATAVATFGFAVYAAALAVAAALPMWSAPLRPTGPHPSAVTWELPVAALVVGLAFLISAGRLGRPTGPQSQPGPQLQSSPQWSVSPLAVLSGVMAALALPASVSLPWWAAAVLSLVLAAILAGVAVFGPTTLSGSTALGSVVLAGFALATGLARPGLTAAVLAGIAVLGLAVAAVALRSRIEPQRIEPQRIEPQRIEPQRIEPQRGAPAAEPPSDEPQQVEPQGIGPPGVELPPRGLVKGGLGSVERQQLAFAATATLVGLLAVPPAVGSALVAARVVPWWAARGTVIAIGLVVAALVLGRRARVHDSTVDVGDGQRAAAWRVPAFVAVLISAVVWPAVAAVAGQEPVGSYAAVSLLIIAAALAAMPGTPRANAGEKAPGQAGVRLSPAVIVGAALAAAPGAIAFAIAVLPAVAAVAAEPYRWLTAIWTGRPQGVGLVPSGDVPIEVHATDAVALALLALASATASYGLTRRVRAAVGGLGIGGPTAVLVALAVAQAPWPSVPAATLLIGLILVGSTALVPVGAWRTTVATSQGIVYIGAGIAGSLSAKWATLTALGLVIVAGAVVGAVGRTVAWRVIGLVAAVGAAVAEVAVAGAAVDRPIREAAFGVLAVAIVALFLGPLVIGRGGRGQAESTAIQAAGHAAAVVALLFTLGWREHSAAVCAVWGVAVGLRALLPGTSRTGRATLAAVAAGFELLAWWLVLLNRGVTLIEAYTLPLAGVALLAGWAALRSRPELRSWVAFGPALVAAFGPSLATVIATTGDPWRRLALGIGALAVVVLGASTRRRAPVVIGGIVLIAVALHELVLLWQLLPGWVPLAVGGVILVGLAITYERRLRDLSRLRSAIGRMT